MKRFQISKLRPGGPARRFAARAGRGVGFELLRKSKKRARKLAWSPARGANAPRAATTGIVIVNCIGKSRKSRLFGWKMRLNLEKWVVEAKHLSGFGPQKRIQPIFTQIGFAETGLMPKMPSSGLFTLYWLRGVVVRAFVRISQQVAGSIPPLKYYFWKFGKSRRNNWKSADFLKISPIFKFAISWKSWQIRSKIPKLDRFIFVDKKRSNDWLPPLIFRD